MIDTPGNISCEYAVEITKAVVGFLCSSAGIVPPATLVQSVAGGNTLEIRWLTAPDVSYSLHGASSLLQTNPWVFIQPFPPTNTTVEYSIALDLDSVSQTVFKVESH